MFILIVCTILLLIPIYAIINNFIINTKYKKEQKRYEEERERMRYRSYNNSRQKQYQNEIDRLLDEMLKQMKEGKVNKQKLYEEYYKHTNYQRQQPPVKKSNTISYTIALKLFKLTDSSTDIEFKKKYKELAMKFHPDRYATDTKENQDIATRNFQKLNEAYEVIKKTKKFS